MDRADRYRWAKRTLLLERHPESRGWWAVFSTGVKRLMVGSALVLSATTLMTSSAFGAGSTLVLSDKTNFADTARPDPSTGVYNFQSSKCRVASDSESGVHEPTTKCNMTGQFKPGQQGTLKGTLTTTSSDGTIMCNVTIKPTGPNTFSMNGKCSEVDNDPNPPPAYSAVVGGQGTATSSSSGLAITGVAKVLESSTAP